MTDYPPSGLSEGVLKLPEVEGLKVDSVAYSKLFSGSKKAVVMKNMTVKRKAQLFCPRTCPTNFPISPSTSMQFDLNRFKCYIVFSNSSNFFAETMRAQPELYEQLKGKTTKLGVNLGHCIKTGIDNKGRRQAHCFALIT